MIKKIPLTGLFILCFIPSFLAGQGYSYVNYNIKEGLAGSMVYCMVQDHDGFIWFGTETGLSRFDGKHFVNFTTLDGLPDNEIVRLFVDSKNRVWIMPFQNKVCYYYKGKLHSEQNDSLLKQVPYLGGVVGIAENKHNEIAIVQSKGVSFITPGNSIIYIPQPATLLNINMAGLNFEGSIQLNTMENKKDNVQFFSIEDHKLVHRENFTEFKVGSANGVYLAKDLRILQRPPDSLVFYSADDRFSIRIDPNFVNMSRLNDSLLAIASRKSTEIFNIRQRRPDGFFMENENISNVLEDREGNLWFASMGNGVYRLASRKYNAATLMVNGNFQPVHAINKLNGMLLIGANNFTLWKLDPASNKLDRMVLNQGASQGRILRIDVPGKDKAIIGTDAGVFILEEGRTSFIPPEFAVKDMVVSGDSILVGHNMGAEWLLLKEKVRKRMEFITRTTAIYNRNDSLFFGTLKGLYIKLPNNQIDSPGKTNSALAGRISSIKKSSDGTLWIGTYGNGVAGLRSGKYFFINRDSGLASNIVRTICPEGQSLWVGTDKGLNKVEPLNGSFKITRYSNADGIISDIINAIYVDSTTIYVGTPAGLTWFKEEEVFTNSMCVLKLTGIRSDRQPSVTDTAKLRFEHYDSDIRFEFTGISFKSAGDISYRYRLTGLDRDWRTTTDNFLNYPTLPSGRYVLELQAVNKFGVKSELMRIDFTIEYLLWEKTWFRILAIIFLAALVWIFVSRRIRSIRRQAELKADTSRKLAELEQMALKAQMNPHFIFNSLNSIQHYMFDKDVESANRYITEFSRLIRLTLEFSSKTRISLEDEVRFLETYLELETRRFEGKFKYHIDVDARLDQAHIFIPPMILQPYIENSIRHGIRYREDNNGIVKLDFRNDGDNLFISVEDNGVGRERSKQLKGQNNIEYQSKGMNLTARRIDMINKISKFPISINISDVHAGNEIAGTKVMIRIPLPK